VRTSLDSITRSISDDCLARKLRSVSRVVSSLYDQALRPHGLRNTQLTLLVAIERWGGEATPTDLGRSLHLEKSTLSRNLSRLEERGWIARRAIGRSVLLTLTDKGEAVVRRAFPAWQAAQAQVAAWAEAGNVEALFDRLPEEGDLR